MAATPYTLTGRVRHVDSNGNIMPGIPISLRQTVSDVAAATSLFVDYDNDKFYTVPPGPPGSVGVRFVDMKASADGVDTKSLVLKVGSAETTLVLKVDQLAEKAVTAETRMQGLSDIIFGQGQRIAFIQKA